MGYDAIEELIQNTKRLVFLDGATGTELYRRGVRSHDLPWSLPGLLYEPEVLREIHYDYFINGANVVTANCFYTTSVAVATIKGLNLEADKIAKTLTYLAIYLARDAERRAHEAGIKHPTCIAGNVTPLELENPYDPMTVLPRGTVIREDREKIQHIIDAGADLILIETMTTLYEAEAALEAASEVGTKLPVWISFSFNERGLLWSAGKEIPERQRDTVEQLVDLVKTYLGKLRMGALLINCTSPEGTTRALDEILRVKPSSFIPLGAKANVEEQVYGKGPYYRMRGFTPSEYVTYCRKWVERSPRDVRIIGGCCGTTPDDIKAVVRAFTDAA